MWYKDPLFGIAILLALIALAGLLDVLLQYRRRKKRQDSINDLRRSYDFAGVKQGVDEFLKLHDNPLPTLEFIAQGYEQSGDLQEAVKIYSSTLESLKNPTDKTRILYLLGRAYLAAGFLQRAKDIFTQIIKNDPRNIDVLALLLKTHRNLGEHQACIDVIDCILEIHADNSGADGGVQSVQTAQIAALKNQKAYFKSVMVMHNFGIDFAQKVRLLEGIRADFAVLDKVILSFYNDYDKSIFWQKFSESSNARLFLDLLWRADSAHLVEFLKAQKNRVLSFDGFENLSQSCALVADICKAKGVDFENLDSENCHIFELEILRVLAQHSDFKADLHFKYICGDCKNIFPFDAHFCPSCDALLTLEPLFSVKQKNEASSDL